MAKRFVLLDRDGTIIVDKHYLHDPKEVELLPNAAEGLKRMQDMGFGLAVLTNQSGVGRGYFTEEEVRACNARMQELLEPYGIVISGFFFCPHSPDDTCDCRKPAPGLMRQAAESLGFDSSESYMIGDKKADVGVGQATSAVSVLVRTGYGRKAETDCGEQADYCADDLLDAAEFIRQRERSKP